jgi:hypothetical protein
MRSLIRWHLILAAGFAVAGVGIPMWASYVVPHRPQLATNADFRKRVDSIQDIEHLRKVLYTVVATSDEAIAAGKATSDEWANVLRSFLLGAATMFGVVGFSLYRLNKRASAKDDGAF